MEMETEKRERIGTVRAAILYLDGTVVFVREQLGGGEKWGLPGGGVRPHESPAEALDREIEEEVCLEGWDVDPNPYDVTDPRAPENPTWLYIVTEAKGALRVKDPEGKVRQCLKVDPAKALRERNIGGVPLKRTHLPMLQIIVEVLRGQTNQGPQLLLRAINARGRVGLVRQKQSPGLPGGWRLPATRFDCFEKNIEALIRRALAETGLTQDGVIVESDPYPAPREIEDGSSDIVVDIYVATTNDDTTGSFRWVARADVEYGWFEGVNILEADRLAVLDPPAGSRMPS